MKLSAYRKHEKLTVADLGRQLGVAHSTVIRWESGEIFPTAEMLERIITVTNGKVTPNDLFQPRKPDPPEPVPATEAAA